VRPALRQALGGLVLIVMAASAAYANNTAGIRDALPPPAVRAAPAESNGSPEGAGPALRSLPWWQPVAQLRGNGDATTEVFDVGPEAIQWRVTWTCAAGRFAATPLLGSGKRGREVVPETPCGEQDQGYAVSSGSLALDVEATGSWTAEVEQQVDVPKVEPLLPGMQTPGAAVLSGGDVYGVDRTGSGRVELHRLPDGSHVLRLVDFSVSINSELEVQLSTVPAPRSTADVVGPAFVSVAALEATAGTMNFVVPAGVDLARYRSVVIWCEVTRNAYAAAVLRR